MSKGLLAVLAWPAGIALAIVWMATPLSLYSRRGVEHMSERLHSRSAQVRSAQVRSAHVRSAEVRSAEVGLQRETRRAIAAEARKRALEAESAANAAAITSAEAHAALTEARAMPRGAPMPRAIVRDDAAAMVHDTHAEIIRGDLASSSSMAVGIPSAHVELRHPDAVSYSSGMITAVPPTTDAMMPEAVMSEAFAPTVMNGYSIWTLLFAFVLATLPGTFATASWRRSVVQKRKLAALQV